MAALATAYPTALLSKDQFRDRLKVERLLELCGESVRWADLKRWGDLETQAGVNQVAARDPDFKNFVIGKHIRLPLPQVEVLNRTLNIKPALRNRNEVFFYPTNLYPGCYFIVYKLR
jgi:hypothetical protein